MLAEVVRSGFVEGVHRGSVVALAADGSVALAAGDPAAPMFPRSANKPLQAAAMLDLGLDLDGELLALAASSHSGEPFHLDGVRAILAAAGLDVAALRTPPDWPYDPAAARAWVRAGHDAEPVAHELLGQARRDARSPASSTAGTPRPTWTRGTRCRCALRDDAGGVRRRVRPGDRGRRLRRAAVRAAADRARHAPYGPACVAEPGTARRRVVDAMRAHPEWVGGTRARRHGAHARRARPGRQGRRRGGRRRRDGGRPRGRRQGRRRCLARATGGDCAGAARASASTSRWCARRRRASCSAVATPSAPSAPSPFAEPTGR